MVTEICKAIEERLTQHIKMIGGKQLLMISTQYPGLWLEHAYDAVIFAKMYPDKLYLAKNTVEIFIENQKPDGQYPFNVCEQYGTFSAGYSHIQECVSFLTLAFEVAELLNDADFDKKAYESGQKWISWLESNRMTLKKGLIEMFVGYDTGHDNSGRLDGLSCKGNYILPTGEHANASVLPPDEQVAPIFAVDMNCNFYGDLTALAKFAEKLSRPAEAEVWRKRAATVKKRLFEMCFDEDDVFFYDADKNGNKRKYRSSTILHLFLEGVLDKQEDGELIRRICERHIKNENEFWTAYPFPSMAINDKSCENHVNFNCWGYYTQGLIVLRCARWMDRYGMADDFDYICRQWVKAWTACYDRIKLGQELDPVTGEPTSSSEWYSSCMLMYLYSAKRLKLI